MCSQSYALASHCAVVAVQADPLGRFAVDIAEADFFSSLLRMAAATSAAELQEQQPDLLASFKTLCVRARAAVYCWMSVC